VGGRLQMTTHRIAVIPGDGIGKEVVPEGIRVLEAAGRRFGFGWSWTHFDWSCEAYARTGRMMPEDGVEQLRPFEGVVLGSVGADVPGGDRGAGGARPRLPVGAPHPDPPDVPPVREPPPGPAPAGRALASGRPRAGGHRHGDHP